MPPVMTLEADPSETSQTPEAAPSARTLDWWARVGYVPSANDLPGDAQAALDRLEAAIREAARRSRALSLAVADCVPSRARALRGWSPW